MNWEDSEATEVNVGGKVDATQTVETLWSSEDLNPESAGSL